MDCFVHDLLTFGFLFANSHYKGEGRFYEEFLGTNTFYGLKIQYGTGKVCLCLESCLEIKWVHLEVLLCPFPCPHSLVPTGVTGHFLCVQVTA